MPLIEYFSIMKGPTLLFILCFIMISCATPEQQAMEDARIQLEELSQCTIAAEGDCLFDILDEWTQTYYQDVFSMSRYDKEAYQEKLKKYHIPHYSAYLVEMTRALMSKSILSRDASDHEILLYLMNHGVIGHPFKSAEFLEIDFIEEDTIWGYARWETPSGPYKFRVQWLRGAEDLSISLKYRCEFINKKLKQESYSTGDIRSIVKGWRDEEPRGRQNMIYLMEMVQPGAEQNIKLLG